MFNKTKWRRILFIAVLFCGIFVISPTQAGVLELKENFPVIVLEKVNMEQAVAGSEFNLTLNVRNISKSPAYRLNFDFKVKDNEDGNKLYPFTLQPGNQNTTIDELKGMQNRTVTLTFAVAPDAQNKDYELLITLKGEDVAFQQVVNTMTTITVPVSYDIIKPVIIVKSVSLNPKEPAEEEEFTAEFQITNLSKTTDARNVMIHLDGTDNFKIMDISNRKNIVKLGKGATEYVTYKLKAKDKKKDNTVKLNISFNYSNSETDETLEEIINLPLPESEEKVETTPRVIVNKYTLSDEKVLAGNTVTLSLFIENTNPREVNNVKISLGVIKIEDSSGNTTTGGTVFSPVNSSNSFYVDSIPGKTVIEKDIDLYVDPNAAAKTYIVPIDIVYEYKKDGGELETLTCEEQVNIPVTQECKLEILSVEAPTTGMVGQPISVSAEFVNVGKVVLGDFMVTMEGDFPKENTTYYVGNLDIGISDYYQGTIIPEKEGKLEGKIVFTYIDNNNKEVRVEEPFSIEIMPSAEPMPGEGEMIGPDGRPLHPGMAMEGNAGGGVISFIKTNWLNILLFLVIFVEAVCIIRIKRKKVNGEFFDE